MRKKQIVVQVILLVAMIFTITACEKESGTVIDFEEMLEENTENDVDTSNKAEMETDFSPESKQEDTQLEKDPNAENEGNQQEIEQSLDSGEESSKEQSITAQSIGQSGEQATNQENEQSQQQDQNPATQSIPTVTINGTIISVGNGEFVIRKTNLISEKLVELQGAYEGNSFMAQKVTIYNFE